jgi:hypothetical protein
VKQSFNEGYLIIDLDTNNEIALLRTSQLLAKKVTEVISFLIEKRYVIAKEVRLKQSFDIEHRIIRLLCFVPHNSSQRR